MNVEVQLFAAARDAAGQSPVTLELPDGATVADLRLRLVETCPNLESLANVLLVAVNSQYAAESQPLNVTDSIACFPPVSGG